MRSWIRPLLALVVLCSKSIKTAAASSKADSKLQFLRSSPAVQIGDADFRKYVNEGPRAYDVFILFTATAKQYRCVACIAAKEQFVLAAESYAAARRSTTEGVKGSEVVFVIGEMPQIEITMRKLALQQAPIVAHFSATDQPGKGDWQMPTFIGIRELITAEEVAKFVERQTGATFAVVHSKTGLIIVVTLSMLLLCVAALAVLNNISATLRLLRRKAIWAVVSIAFYAYSISGGIYCLLRGAAFGKIDPQTNRMVWFHPAGNVQFIAEGYFFGLLNLATAACVISVIFLAPRLKNTILKQAIMASGSISAYFLYTIIVSTYTMKNTWYMRDK